MTGSLSQRRARQQITRQDCNELASFYRNHRPGPVSFDSYSTFLISLAFLYPPTCGLAAAYFLEEGSDEDCPSSEALIDFAIQSFRVGADPAFCGAGAGANTGAGQAEG